MSKKKSQKSNKTNGKNGRKRGFPFHFSFPDFSLPEEVKKWIWGIFAFTLAAIFVLSFFDSAGMAGQAMKQGLLKFIGHAVFAIPLILVLGGLVFFNTSYKNFFWPALLAMLILVSGIAGFLESLFPNTEKGGFLGYIFNFPLQKMFGSLAAKIIFIGFNSVGGLILWQLFVGGKAKEEKKEKKEEPGDASQSERGFVPTIKKIFAPKFTVKEVEPKVKETFAKSEAKPAKMPAKSLALAEYKLPPLDLLESETGKPSAGDTATNSAIIKKTLENFGLKVEMSEINIGPTVTQYSLKPAEGIKLSKITGLNTNLSLALASHPIRIEAPIPGKPLVGIEVPNKERCKVRLRDMLSGPDFQKAGSSLNLALGKDVAGNLCYADLARMPHLLVAGSTGTGKTIYLNNLILSLLYQNSPQMLRLILVDPKRVEFSAYANIPHLLCPVIFDAQKTVNALKWLISEMENRFSILSTNGSRDITSYNSKIIKEMERDRSKEEQDEEQLQTLPYIVLIVDELADLMASRGRDVEAGIVRLAQMARAVGIHLVVATQRPSVEVITGLIKANITSRVTFQVASQVDSRTVLDSAGAEKLLGMGDLLFISAQVPKPKRIQGAFVSEKEVKRVVDFIKTQNAHITKELQEEASEIKKSVFENHLAEDLEKSLVGADSGFDQAGSNDEALYEEAKKIVLEAKKASASLLQRRLRIGYARAARLLDMLEEGGVVGPGEGAKPREVFLGKESLAGEGLDTPSYDAAPADFTKEEKTESEDDDGWEKV